jgi:hypothetical protein
MKPELYLYWTMTTVPANSFQQLRLTLKDNSLMVKTLDYAITYNNGGNWRNIGTKTGMSPNYLFANDTSYSFCHDTFNLVDTVFNQLSAFCKIRVIATDLDGNNDTAFTPIFSISGSSAVLREVFPQKRLEQLGPSYDLLGRNILGNSTKIYVVKNMNRPVLKFRKP